MGKKYLLFMVQVHLNFRLAELESLADLFKVDVDFTGYSEDSPFMVVELKDDQAACDWIKRSILTRAIYEYWGQGVDYKALHDSIQKNDRYEEYRSAYEFATFKFEFERYGGNFKQDVSARVEIIESFKYLEFKGKIRMKNPDEVFSVIEEYRAINDNVGGEIPIQIYFGTVSYTHLDVYKRQVEGSFASRRCDHRCGCVICVDSL